MIRTMSESSGIFTFQQSAGKYLVELAFQVTYDKQGVDANWHNCHTRYTNYN